jgi:hypothetical protein
MAGGRSGQRFMPSGAKGGSAGTAAGSGPARRGLPYDEVFTPRPSAAWASVTTYGTVPSARQGGATEAVGRADSRSALRASRHPLMFVPLMFVPLSGR